MKCLTKFSVAFSFLLSCLLMPSLANAQFTIEFDFQDFSTVGPGATGLSTVNALDFELTFSDPLVAGGVYDESLLSEVVYTVGGDLAPGVPSTFPNFLLNRTIGGQEFIDQGSSLSFTVSATADLSDGLQTSELVADANGRTFLFNGLEINTGRFHPPLLELFDDGTGEIQNSNNNGGINPVFGATVDVDFGEEFQNALTFSSFDLVAAVPEPSSTCVLLLAGLTAMGRRRR